MAMRSCSSSPTRWKGASYETPPQQAHAALGEGAKPSALTDRFREWGTLPKQKAPAGMRGPLPPGDCRRSSSASPPRSEHASRIRRPRQRAAAQQTPPSSAGSMGHMPAPTPTCTPTQTPTATPLQTPNGTPSRTPACLTERLSSPISPVWMHGGDALPPVPSFTSRRPPSPATAAAGVAADVAAAATAGAGAVAGPALGGLVVNLRSSLGKKGSNSDRMFDGRAGPFAGQCGPFGKGNTCASRGDKAAAGRRGRGSFEGGGQGGAQDGVPSRRPEPGGGQDRAVRVMPSIDTEVDGMLDKSKGTLRLLRDALGDERVPSLSLRCLKDAYRAGRGSVRSWTTAGLFRSEHVAAESGAHLIEVEQGRLGVLSSTEAYLFHFQMKAAPEDGAQIAGGVCKMDSPEGGKTQEGFHLMYLWLGREAGAEARTAARAQGATLLGHHSSSPSQLPLLDVEQGCEPALFLALFSYMLPPLAAVVLQGREQTPDLRVLELQESPCLHESGIALAVEGDASLLAKHGPLPGRSYVILVRPRRRRVGSGGSSTPSGSGSSEGGRSGGWGGGGGGGEAGSRAGVGAFDEGYYWHGVGETPAVEEVGILLCQQVDRMFPSPLTIERVKRRRRGAGKRRRIDVAGLGCGMMRGYVADVKLGLPVPDGFWACIFPQSSGSTGIRAGDRRLLSQDLSPGFRSRPVRVFGVCAESRKARQSFVWEVTCGGMPSQMRLSPSLSHVVDAGGPLVYVWHGAGSHGDGRRLALRVARAYVTSVEGGTAVEEADAGSEPVRLLDCFIGWNQALVEPPPMLSFSPQGNDARPGSAAGVSPLTTPTTAASREASWSTTDGRRSRPGCEEDLRRRLSGGRASSGSNSSASRLTPPGQRTPPLRVNSPGTPPLRLKSPGTPPLRVNSPPSLKTFVRGAASPARFHGTAAADAGLFPSKSELFLATTTTTPRRRRSAAFDSLLARYDGSIGRDNVGVLSPLSPPTFAPPNARVPNPRRNSNAAPGSTLPFHADRKKSAGGEEHAMCGEPPHGSGDGRGDGRSHCPRREYGGGERSQPSAGRGSYRGDAEIKVGGGHSKSDALNLGTIKGGGGHSFGDAAKLCTSGTRDRVAGGRDQSENIDQRDLLAADRGPGDSGPSEDVDQGNLPAADRGPGESGQGEKIDQGDLPDGDRAPGRDDDLDRDEKEDYPRDGDEERSGDAGEVANGTGDVAGDGGGSNDGGDGSGSSNSGGGGSGSGGGKDGNDSGDTNNGEGGGEEEEEDEDEEEGDTFLRLSEVEFCEGAGALRRAVSVVGSQPPPLPETTTSSEGPRSSCGRRSSGSGDGGRVPLSRHLSDFFRSPLSLDSTTSPTPKLRLSPGKSLADVQTGVRLFDSVKSSTSECSGAHRDGSKDGKTRLRLFDSMKSTASDHSGAHARDSSKDSRAGLGLFDSMKSAASDYSGAHARGSSILVDAENFGPECGGRIANSIASANPGDAFGDGRPPRYSALFEDNVDGEDVRASLSPLPAAETAEGALISENVETEPSPEAFLEGGKVVPSDVSMETLLDVASGAVKRSSIELAAVESGKPAFSGEGGGGGSIGGRESEEEWLSHPGNGAVVSCEGGESWADGGHGSSNNNNNDNDNKAFSQAEEDPSSSSSNNNNTYSQQEVHGEASRCGNGGGQHVPPSDKGASASSARPEEQGQPRASSKGGSGGALKSLGWAGLDEDGMWRSEVARRAAGQAGAVEANRRRLAKISRDESWRSDASAVGNGEAATTAGGGAKGTRDIRRDSTSFIRMQSGNVRDKLSMFEGGSGASTGKDKCDNRSRSSIGALNGRGLVSSWSKRKMIAVEEQSNAGSARSGGSGSGDGGGGSCPPWRDEGLKLRHPRHDQNNAEEEQGVDFLWKQGPSPPPLKGRPSLGLIRTGQVRNMSKQLVMLCPDGVQRGIARADQARAREEGAATSMEQDLEGACGAQVDSSAESHDAQDAPLPVSPLPALPVAAVTPPPLPTRLLRSGGAGAAGRSTKAQGNFWWAKGSWAKAGLAMTSSRKKMEAAAASAAAAAAAATPSSAPVSPARGLRSVWSKNGGARTPPPSYGSATAGRAPGEAGGGVGAAAGGDATPTRGGRYRRLPTWGSGK